jgi:hypothetical protein
MARRKHERPVEHLRTAWTSTADLEETLASMFGEAEAAPDNLSPTIPVNLPAPPVKLAPATPDKLSVVAKPTPDKLSGGATEFETLDGDRVESRFVRPYRLVQDGHTSSEHLVYTAMYKLAGGDPDAGKTSREAIIPLQAVAERTAISLRNIRRVVRSLEAKLAIEVTEFEDKAHAIPRRYRIWSMNAILERRRQRGYEYVYRSRNLITLARPLSPDKLTPGRPDRLTVVPPASLTGVPPDNQDTRPPDSLSGNTEELFDKKARATLVAAVHREFGFVDDDAIARIASESRRAVPDLTNTEIAWAVTLTSSRIRLMRNLKNPVGMLITQVPRCFVGESFRLYREAERQRQEAERREQDQWRAEARRLLEDPDRTPDEETWARAVLELD